MMPGSTQSWCMWMNLGCSGKSMDRYQGEEAGCGMNWEIGIGMCTLLRIKLGFLGGAVIKNPSANAGNVGSIPGSRRFPGGGNGNLLQCSCLENSVNRGAGRATIHRVTKSQTQPSAHSCTASSVV